MRGVYVMRNGRLVRKEKAAPLKSGPMTISDDLKADLQHHGYDDGRTTSSKSTFRRWTREAGLVEKGNDRIPGNRPLADLRADVGRAIQMCREGYRPQYRRVEGLDS
jgi:hypothetical protein